MVLLATYAVENRIKAALKDLGVSSIQFAFFSNGYISQQRLSAGLSGLKPFDNAQGTRLEELVRELQELAASVAPLKIDFRHVVGVQQALETRRQAARSTPTKTIL
jgi:hypothetical protein